ncbi:hypothetical protein EVA_22133 [gut metagenome]|uniref:Uncharacterized protein n=1 Tax=gut metagenome TaxID=749906 RepID=J9FQW1_9ZZZZ
MSLCVRFRNVSYNRIKSSTLHSFSTSVHLIPFANCAFMRKFALSKSGRFRLEKG